VEIAIKGFLHVISAAQVFMRSPKGNSAMQGALWTLPSVYRVGTTKLPPNSAQQSLHKDSKVHDMTCRNTWSNPFRHSPA
jgi:hypothetical protein